MEGDLGVFLKDDGGCISVYKRPVTDSERLDIELDRVEQQKAREAGLSVADPDHNLSLASSLQTSSSSPFQPVPSRFG